MINSSSELAFKPGTLRFSFGGSARVTWTGTVEMLLDMEFHHLTVDCFFRLHLSRSHVGVAITYVHVDGKPCHTALEAGVVQPDNERRPGGPCTVRPADRSRGTQAWREQIRIATGPELRAGGGQ